MKKCNFCGEVIQDNIIICPWCGHPDPELISDKKKLPKPDPRTPPDIFSGDSNFNRILKIFSQKKVYIVFLGIIASIFLLLLFSLKQSPKNASEIIITNSITQTISVTPSTEPTMTPKKITPKGVVLVSSLRIRNGPGTSFTPIGLIKINDGIDIIGRDFSSSWIKIILKDGGEGWVSSLNKHVKLNMPINQIPITYFRPLTSRIQPLKKLGKGEFNINNDTDYDAVIILTSNDVSITAAYVRKNESFTIKGIPSGDFFVYFSEGVNWMGKNFEIINEQARFLDVFHFENSSYFYSIWTIYLKPTLHGNASSYNVSNNNFPNIFTETDSEK